MKKGSKIICGFLAVTLVTGILFNNVSSMSIKGVNADQRPIKEIVKDVSIYTDKYVPLMDAENKEIAGYYETIHGGYAIIESDGEVIEFDDDTPIDGVKDYKDLYYMGPTQIFEKKNDKLVSLQNESYEVAFNDIQGDYYNFIAEAKNNQDDSFYVASDEENQTTENYVDTLAVDDEGNVYEETGDPQATVAPGVWINLKGGHGNTLNKNTDLLNTNRSGKGNCGSTAAAIMLLYYDRYVSTKYVDNKYRKEKNWQAFTNKLMPYIELPTRGSTVDSLHDGINKYLKTRNIRPVCFIASKGDWYKTPTEILIDKIDANRPIILRLISHPTFGNHAVVAEGYFVQDSGKKYTYACINSGWGISRTSKGKRLYVNVAYAEDAVYLN